MIETFLLGARLITVLVVGVLVTCCVAHAIAFYFAKGWYKGKKETLTNKD